DCGTTVGGYRGDGGRTFVYGRVKPAAERLFGVLQEAHDRACEAIRPGVEVGEIFRIAQGHISRTATHASAGATTGTLWASTPFTKSRPTCPRASGRPSKRGWC
ncbi:MAG: aminopeptidase P family protein, partial [Rubrobacteraceae bacterium]|nr:aminopeptidase P family protein [Rubrobacteraceae bacterium]